LTDPWLSLQQDLISDQIFIPRIPAELREGLVKLDGRTWSNREDVDVIAIYLFREPALEVVKGPVQPYFTFADTGHGVNSNTYALSLMTKKAAIFLQFHYGPVYTDYVRARLRIAQGFLLLDRLLRSLPEGDGPIDYVLAYSSLRGHFFLERDESAPQTEIELLGPVEGWSEVDFRSVAVSDGKSSSLDGQLFDWAEPLDFKLCAAKFLCSMNADLENGR
jgi:hypothetical protein